MIVAVGSTRPPKVEAVREAFRRIRRRCGWPADEPEVLARDVPHSAPTMPVSVQDLVGGAFLRVRALRRHFAQRGEQADLWIGLEGGLNVLEVPAHPNHSNGGAPSISTRQVFLESWVYVESNRLAGDSDPTSQESPEASDGRFGAVNGETGQRAGRGRLEGCYARGGGIVVPEVLASMVLDQGRELGQAVDAYVGGCDIRSKNGTWGVLTRDLVSRQDSFVTALIAALAPFYNSGAYGAGVHRAEPATTTFSSKSEAK